MSKPKIYDYFVLVYDPKHPRAVGLGYVPEQILVAEKVLGRGLTPDEDIRHVNGDTRDNRPANLEITSTNSDYRVQTLVDEVTKGRSTAKSFISCKFQNPCWKNIRRPIIQKEAARGNPIYLPYICSFQTGGDIYKCSHFWKFIEAEISEEQSV